MDAPLKVLVVKCSALGDVLRATCLLPALRRRTRGRVSWLVSPEARPLLEKNPYLERVHVLRPGGGPVPGRFDLVLSLEESRAAALAAQRACRGELVGVVARRRGLGYTASSASLFDMSLLNRDPDGGHARADSLKAANRRSYGRLCLGLLGVRGPCPRPVLRLSRGERSRALDFARHRGLRPGEAVGFNPGAGRRWPSKQLSEEGSARLLAGLERGLGRPVILFGGQDERGRNRRILERARSLGARRGLDAGVRPLREFAALLGLCAAVVSTDSLAFHAGTALGLGVVALVGPTSAAELDVFGRGAILTPPGGCGCFYERRCLRPEGCLDRIPVEAVVREALSLLGPERGNDIIAPP